MVATAAMGEPTNYKIDIKERKIPEMKGPTTLGEMSRAVPYVSTEDQKSLSWKSHPLEKCTACHKGGDELIIASARQVPEFHKVCETCSAQKAEKSKIERKAKKAPAKKIAKKAPVKKTVKKAVVKTAEPKRVAKKDSKKAELSILLIPHSGKFYSVKKGDTLIAIAKRSRMHWQVLYSLNRDVIGKNPNRIFPGQSLKMPNEGVFHWVNPGADPYGDRSVKKAIYGFDLLLAVKEKAYDAVTKTQGEAGEIKPGQTIRQMWFGKGLADNVLAVFPTAIEARIWRVEHEGYLYTFFRPGCTNWSWTVGKISPREIAPIEDKELTRELEAPREEVIPSEGLILGPAEGFPSGAPDFEDVGRIDGRRLFDLYAGGGMYDDFNDHSGGYFWTKARLKPFNYEFSNGARGNWGFFGTYALGEGNDNGFSYDWDRYALGLTTSILGESKDFDLDVGIGQQFNDGKQGLYRGEQKDNIFLISAHGNFYGRRDAGKLWFPKVEANLELILPFDRNHEHSWNGQPLPPNPFNNRYAELMVTQYVYDFKFKNGVRITPGVNYGFSSEYGGRGSGETDHFFYQIGPTAALSYKGNDILKLSVMNFKDGVSDHLNQQWHIFSLSLDIGGSLRAIKASGIKEIVME